MKIKMNRQEVVQLIEEFNFNEVKSKIDSENRLIRYIKVLPYLLHAINAVSIILSVLSETIKSQIIYAVIACSILNSVLNYEALKANSNLQNNTKLINSYLKQLNIDQSIFMTDNVFGKTPCNTPMISV